MHGHPLFAWSQSPTTSTPSLLHTPPPPLVALQVVLTCPRTLLNPLWWIPSQQEWMDVCTKFEGRNHIIIITTRHTIRDQLLLLLHVMENDIGTEYHPEVGQEGGNNVPNCTDNNPSPCLLAWEWLTQTIPPAPNIRATTLGIVSNQ